MFEEISLPKKITPSPIAEAVFEVRFTSNIPGTALCGLFFPVFSEIFPNNIIEELPILQFPPMVRDSDPNLKFQPHYRVVKDNLNFAFGPNSLAFSCMSPYIGWESWSQFFLSIIKKLGEIEILKGIQINRLGLRYIDTFDGNILENTKTNFTISEESLASFNTQIHSEFVDNDILIILTLSNGVKQPDQKMTSIIDIDSVKDCDINISSFLKEVCSSGLLDLLHDTNKKFFFGLLKDDFLEKLNPEY